MSASAAVTLGDIAPLPFWVAWQTEDRPDGKPTKVPYSPNGGKAKADDPGTWGTREQAKKRAAELPKPYNVGGIGLEFCELTDGCRLGGIDLDSCRDPDTGAIATWAQKVIDCVGSYTEVSPSGTGVKVFFQYASDDLEALRAAMGGPQHGKQFKRGGGDHPEAIEIHLGNRYFAVTDNAIAGSSHELRLVDTSVLLQLLQIDGPAFARKASEKAKRGSTDRSRSAIAFRKGRDLRKSGATFEEMVAALLADPETADWTREKGMACGQRELKRIWDKAGASGPVIRVVAGEIHMTATAAEEALIAAGLPIFQHGDRLVQPISREVPASLGRTVLAAGLGEMNVHSSIDLMSENAQFERFDSRNDDWVRTNPPMLAAQILLKRAGRWRFPVIAGVVTTPTIRPNGSLLIEQGYDPVTKLYHVADTSLRLHPAVFKPTRQHAEAALACLRELIAEFPFTDDFSKAVGYSILITPVVRAAMAVAPLQLVGASTPGTGKSYFMDVASAIATGRPCPVITAGESEAETEKRLAGLLMAGHPLISLDNVNGELGGDLLCQAVERPIIRLRQLGSYDIIEIASTATVLATGNNARVRGDMVRRTIIANLDAKVERPELRQFRGDPVATVLADRGHYVSACLIIVRAYLEAGSPNQPKPIASYADWSRLVRGALMWLGCADPAETMNLAREDDPELAELREVMTAWESNLGSSSFTTKEIAQRIEAKVITEYGPTGEFQYPELREAVLRLFGERDVVNTRRFGNWLSAKEGRPVNGRRFKRAKTVGTGGVAQWQVQPIGR